MLAREPLDESKDPWSGMIEAVVDGSSHLSRAASSEIQEAEQHSQRLRLIRRMAEEGVHAATVKGLAPGSREAWDVVDHAAAIGRSIVASFDLPEQMEELTPAEAWRAFAMTLSRNDARFLIDHLRRHGQPRVDLPGLEQGVGFYLSSEHRNLEVDKLLLLSLAEAELTHFIHTMIEPDLLAKRSRLQEASVSAGWRWTKGRLLALVINLTLIALIMAALIYLPGVPAWAATAGLSVAGLLGLGFILWTLTGAVLLLARGKEMNAPGVKLREQVEAASSFVKEFASPTALSLLHFRRRVEELRVKGIIWPQTLWALLDDVEERGARRL